MRAASFVVRVEDTEQGDDRINLEFVPLEGDEALMLDVIQMIVNGGKDPELHEVIEDE